jgi:hypothetical protein
MKTTLTFAAIVLMLAGSFSCGKEDSTKLLLQNVENSSCHPVSLSSNANDDSREYIKCVAIDEHTLRFEQLLSLNCCLEKVNASIVAENKTILINVCEDNTICNCICPITVNYEITNLQENHTYRFSFQHCGHDYYSCEITFASNLEETIFNL